MTDGPTRGASDGRAWPARPARALAVRAVVLTAPTVVAFAVTHLVARWLWHPPGVAGFLVFVAQLAVVGSAAGLTAARGARRLLPLASLLNMTLVFPDRAPSRFGVALRSGTTRQLQRSLASGVAWPEDLQKAAEQLLAMIGALGRHDRRTRGHTERVRAYADLIGQELGLRATERELLHWGALAHDVGKLTVPTEILNGGGRPSDEEWRLLASHPAAGARMLEPLAPWLGEWRLAAGQHHERWDGTGYPSGLAGQDISLAGRIVAVADAYDVITSTRSYKKAMSLEAAREELVRCSGTQFDPEVVRALLSASLTKDRLATGFLGWFTELGGFSALPRGAAQAVAGVATASAVAVGAVGAVNPLIVPPTEHVVAQGEIGEPGDSPPPSLAAVEEPPVAEHASGTAATDPPRASTTGPAASPQTTAPGPTEPGGTDPQTSLVDSTGTPSTAGSTIPWWSPPTTVGPPTTTGWSTTASTATSTTISTTTTSSTTTTTQATTTTTLATTTTASTTTTTLATTTTAPGTPTPIDDAATVKNDKDVSIRVLDNDGQGSAPFDEATLVIVTPPAHAKNGTDYRVHNDHIHYRSEKNYVGTDTLVYRICNTDGLCNTATVTYTVTA